MIHNVRVVHKIQEEVDRLNEPLENYKRIRKFVLSSDEWSTESGEFMASFKLMREQVMQKFRKEIERIYG
jgi:long-subunit acyl-CoA synthetase (AMP-forming)